MTVVGNTLLALTAVGTFAPTAFPQSVGSAMSATAQGGGNGLMSIADAEEKRGIALFYTQNYRSGNRPVQLNGSLYAAITAFAINKCNLTIGATVVDRYSGQFGKSSIKDTQSKYDYSIEFALTQEIANSLRMVEARPVQLDQGTNPMCAERRACTIYWLELRSKGPAIKLTSLTDDIAGYDGVVRNMDGMVDRFRIPVSSLDAGKELISKLQSYAIKCVQ
jgi:hypothetical protein